MSRNLSLRRLAAVGMVAATFTAHAADDAGIAWKYAATDVEVDQAFTQASTEKKPLFLYWGAKWCPPCNQLSATLFNRQDFIERSRAFVPVYVDGDSPGAQKLGARFKVRGYPTMLLFNPQGTEVTRLPGEVDAAQYTQVLTLGMSAQRPVKAVLSDARGGPEKTKRLSANDWKLLAFYSWETDEQQVVHKQAIPLMLRQLATECPPWQTETSTRLLLKAVAAQEAQSPTKPGAKPPTWPDAAARTRVMRLLADPSRPRTHMDVLTNNAAELAGGLSQAGTPERVALLDALNTALKRLADDGSLSRADRMTAVIARVNLARLSSTAATVATSNTAATATAKSTPPAKAEAMVLPAELLAEVRDHTARAENEIIDGYERQAVITTAAYMLEQAGLLDESDTLLKANLARSHSPYYLMSDLAGNARKRGDNAEALRWSEEAFDKSEGPATRLQWGAAHLGMLVELAPREAERIEKLAQQLIGEAAAQPNAFYERSARSLQRVSTRLQAWNQEGKHAGAIARLQTQLNAVCRRLDSSDPQRLTCERLLRPEPKKAA